MKSGLCGMFEELTCPVVWGFVSRAVSIAFNVKRSPWHLKHRQLFVAACRVVLVVNLFDLLYSLSRQPYTLIPGMSKLTSSETRNGSESPCFLFFFYSVTNLFVCSLTECPATGGRRSSGADPDHTRCLCSHTEPPDPGAALLGHAHSLQHRWLSLPNTRLERFGVTLDLSILSDYQLTSADITALHALASPGGLLPASVSTWQQQTVSQQPQQQQQQQQQLNLASLSNLV